VSTVTALILAAPVARDRVLVGVSLSERARRSAKHAGIAPERIHVVRDPATTTPPPNDGSGPVVVIDARAQVIMPAFVRALLAGDDVPDDACHPAGTDAEARAATAWLWRFIHKPELDSVFTRYLCRPLARPLTHLFVRLPFSPNQITIVSILLGWLGCALAAGAGYRAHVLGLALLVFGNGLLDAIDGEVARLRLQFSRAGDWLDAFGDHTIRFALILALGSHVAAQLPALPVWPVTLATAGVTLAAMLPMYWYCLSVHRTINLQHYGDVVRGSRLGVQLSSRDFTDYAFLLLAVGNLSVISLAGTAAGAVVALATVVTAHPRAIKRRRAARRPALA
jgi:phosphatidylglycerophosphate synthase